jgi:hypothetical protein
MPAEALAETAGLRVELLQSQAGNLGLWYATNGCAVAQEVSRLIPPTAQQSSWPIMRRWFNRSNSDRCTKWTQSHPTPKKQKTKNKICDLNTKVAFYKVGWRTLEPVSFIKFFLYVQRHFSKRPILLKDHRQCRRDEHRERQAFRSICRLSVLVLTWGHVQSARWSLDSGGHGASWSGEV